MVAPGWALTGPDAFNFELLVTNEVVLLRVIEVVDGDYNQDGIVDAADYAVWRDQSAQTGLGLTADGDRDVDGQDWQLWRDNYGSSANSVAVPEPTTGLLVGYATLLGLARRAGRRAAGSPGAR